MSEKGRADTIQNTTETVMVPRHVEPILAVIGELAASRGMPAYAVGGCVRDWLLEIARTTDLDLTIVGNGIVFARQMAQALGAGVKLHEQFGTATVLAPWSTAGGRPPRHGFLRIDLATARKETYARPAAYPKVSAGTLEEDLFRRDFTVNAMAVALAPGQLWTLIDPFGGRKALRRQELRMLHRRSFLDDPSRILRGLRFGQRFGLRWERQTERAMKEALAAGALGWLNAGRLQKELDRMTREPDPRRCFDALAALLAGCGKTLKTATAACSSIVHSKNALE